MFCRVPLMLWMQVLKHLAEAFQCWNVNVVHCVVFQQQSIIASFIGIMLLLVIIVTNIMYIHSGKLWVVLGIGLGAEAFALALTWYLHRKGWV